MLNRVLLIGRLTRDPETRYTSSGSAVTNFGLANNRRFKVNDEPREETLFVDVTVFGKQAETVAQYCEKGKEVLVEGRLTLSQWETDDGQKRSRIFVTADRVQFMSSREESTDSPVASSSVDDDLPF